jgi:hypothetical protein
MSPALSAAISCSGRCAVASVETPQVSDSGAKNGFAAWMGGSRSSLDALCCGAESASKGREGLVACGICPAGCVLWGE